jgi:hypothetical protein
MSGLRERPFCFRIVQGRVRFAPVRVAPMLRFLTYRASRIAGVAALLGIACGAGVITAPNAPGTARAEAATRDLGLTIQARRALLRDTDLGGLNLGVRVHNRVAILWGPVPTVELAFKAEVCLRELIELTEVRNQLFVTGDDMPASGPSQSPLPAFLPPASPPVLPGLPTDNVRVTPSPAAPRSVVQPPPPPPDEEIELPPLRLPNPKK